MRLNRSSRLWGAGLAAVLLLGGSAQGQGISTNILVEPKNANTSLGGVVIVCPVDGAWEFSVLPVAYERSGDEVVAVGYPCGLEPSASTFCTQTARLEVAAYPVVGIGENSAAASAQSCGSSCQLCANLDADNPGDPACSLERELYPAPVARLPVVDLLGGDDTASVLVRVTGRRGTAGNRIFESTQYNPVNADVAFSPILGPGISNAPAVVRLAGEDSNDCQ